MANFSRALEIKEKRYGVGHWLTADSMINLGSVYWRKGNYEKATEMYKKGLLSQLEHYGKDHYEIAHTYYNLGLFCKSMNSNQKAYQFFDLAYEIYRKQFADEHHYLERTFN